MLIGAYRELTEAESVIRVSENDANKAGIILNSALKLWGCTEEMEDKGWDPYSVGWEEVAEYYLDKEKLQYEFVYGYDDEKVVWCHDYLADLPTFKEEK